MATQDMVFVKSMGKGTIGFSLPNSNYRRDWPKRGTRLPVPKDVLREAFYYPGVEYLFRQGLLYIEDMEFKKELGLEADDATEPTVVALDEKLLDRYSTKMPLSELKRALGTLSVEQKKLLAEYMIEHYETVSMDRIQLVEEASGIKIFKRIEIEKADKENVAGEE